MQLDVLLRVRYGECDAQNVVFNARYADYVDVASTEYMRYLCGGYVELTARGLETQVVSLQIDWQSPARFDDVLVARMGCDKVGNRSFSLYCDFLQHRDNTPVARAKITYVAMDAKTFEPISVPDWMRSALSAEGEITPVNLAGEIEK